MQLVHVNSIFAVIGINKSVVYSYSEFHLISTNVGGMRE